MNKKQWITFGIISFLTSMFLWTMRLSWGSTTIASGTDLYTIAVIKSQSYAIPAILLFGVSMACMICAGLEKKN